MLARLKQHRVIDEGAGYLSTPRLQYFPKDGDIWKFTPDQSIR